MSQRKTLCKQRNPLSYYFFDKVKLKIETSLTYIDLNPNHVRDKLSNRQKRQDTTPATIFLIQHRGNNLNTLLVLYMFYPAFLKYNFNIIVLFKIKIFKKFL